MNLIYAVSTLNATDTTPNNTRLVLIGLSRRTAFSVEKRKKYNWF